MRAMLLLCLLAGCRDGTSVLVRIDQGDVTIPGDVAALHVRVTNPELSADAATFDSQVLPLCGPDEAKGCYALPLSVALRPGDSAPDALVRAEVTALDGSGNEVIHDAAEFHFASGEQSTLDFFLTKACLNSACATEDQLCGRNGGCVVGTLGTTSSPDLSITPSGTIVREAVDEGSLMVGSTYVLTGPADAQPGDLLVAVSATGSLPAGWISVYQAYNLMVSYHRVGQSETAASYTFGNTLIESTSWLVASYRGVSSVVPGATLAQSTDGSFAFPSMAVPVTGSILIDLFGSQGASDCMFDGNRTEFSFNQIELDEATGLVAGSTGARTYACNSMANLQFGAQLLLVP